MSFALVLDVPGLTWAQADAVARASEAPGHWPVYAGARRSRWRRRPQPPSLWLPEEIDDRRHLLTDEADWDAPAWDMDRDLLPLLAATVGLLAEHLPQGFRFRATWGGDEVRHERRLSATDLQRLVLASELNEYTRYEVPGRAGRAFNPPAASRPRP